LERILLKWNHFSPTVSWLAGLVPATLPVLAPPSYLGRRDEPGDDAMS
jgi:hypothetical protein